MAAFDFDAFDGEGFDVAGIPMTQTTRGLDLIKRSLSVIGVLGLGQAPDPDMANAALVELESLTDSWRLERLTIGQVVRSVQVLESGVQTYTIGPDGDFDVARPVWIEGAGLLLTAGTQRETHITILSDQKYRELRDKGLTSAAPRWIYYDKGFDANGMGLIYVLDTPSVDGLRLVLYLPTSTVDIADLSTTLFSLPPGYSRALKYNLARELSTHYPGTWSELLEGMAVESKAWIKRVNEVPAELKSDAFWIGRGSAYDIMRGY